ncbi:YgdI/YgdR family lipoprotein [Paenalcaligenes niemegkensis]|uniref:YgdI/YgdR family lipoprotein n=1 Tax=Paenalcaligenes niemegkensis TaxID=2895469 RepID=UPI001EE95BCD|nr:YgdI/YgdR family lipoprotein [Paenalcaligenes niemegkensis]MCQ9617688.1 YgdI/YgdR family lipoprotein [Paenalcaligenes niemegkensis]
MSLKASMAVAVLTAGGLLVGCSTPTEITTTDGQTVTSPDRPQVNDKDDFITYEKDGKEVRVNKDEVRRMEEVK